LAGGTGLTISFLSQVERDVVSPSIGSLQKIARTLGTSAGTFFGDPVEGGVLLLRRQSRPKSVHGSAKIESLASGLLHLSLEPKFVTLEPKGRLSGEHIPRGSEAFGFVVSGSVELARSSEPRMVLQRGDSVYLRQPWPYVLVNPGPQRAELVWILCSAAL
jgi:transcriptional regulator with XRE-family HTH domain